MRRNAISELWLLLSSIAAATTVVDIFSTTTSKVPIITCHRLMNDFFFFIFGVHVSDPPILEAMMFALINNDERTSVILKWHFHPPFREYYTSSPSLLLRCSALFLHHQVKSTFALLLLSTLCTILYPYYNYNHNTFSSKWIDEHTSDPPILLEIGTTTRATTTTSSTCVIIHLEECSLLVFLGIGHYIYLHPPIRISSVLVNSFLLPVDIIFIIITIPSTITLLLASIPHMKKCGILRTEGSRVGRLLVRSTSTIPSTAFDYHSTTTPRTLRHFIIITTTTTATSDRLLSTARHSSSEIKLLLVRGCIESNPGPRTLDNAGQVQTPTGANDNSNNNNNNDNDTHLLSRSDMENAQLGRLLGKGGYGKVYEAKLPSSPNKKIAVKEVKIHGKKSWLLAENEIENWKKVSSPPDPYIVTFLGHIVVPDEDGKPVCRMFMDLAEISLQNYLWSKYPRLPTENEIRPIMMHIIIGLLQLHSVGVLHGDLKAANILLFDSDDDDGTSPRVARIADFGLSKYIGRNGVTCRRAGTPGWMAPEVENGHGYTLSADIWSFGCVLIEMLTGGQRPWVKDDAGDRVLKAPFFNSAVGSWMIPNGNNPISISDDCQDFLSQCFIRDPTNRPTIQELLAHRWLQQDAAPPPPPPPTPQLTSTPHNCSTAAPVVVDEQQRRENTSPQTDQSFSGFETIPSEEIPWESIVEVFDFHSSK